MVKMPKLFCKYNLDLTARVLQNNKASWRFSPLGGAKCSLSDEVGWHCKGVTIKMSYILGDYVSDCDYRQSGWLCSSCCWSLFLPGPSGERRLSEVLRPLPFFKDRENHLHHHGISTLCSVSSCLLLHNVMFPQVQTHGWYLTRNTNNNS